ncbi:RGS20 family protein [Megaselia abdita]
MSCYVAEFPSGCRLRRVGSHIQSNSNISTHAKNSNNRNGTRSSGNGTTETTDIHGVLGDPSTHRSLESSLKRSQHSTVATQRGCFWLRCCCSCSCLAIKNGEDNGPKKKPESSDLLDGEQPSLEEIRSWGRSFEKLMKSSRGRKVFRDFLKCEYSEENILFWLACEDLKHETNQDTIGEKARHIYDDYISILSPKEVSLDSRVRDLVNKNMVEPTPNTFDEAQLQIYTLMHRDSYPR